MENEAIILRLSKLYDELSAYGVFNARGDLTDSEDIMQATIMEEHGLALMLLKHLIGTDAPQYNQLASFDIRGLAAAKDQKELLNRLMGLRSVILSTVRPVIDELQMFGSVSIPVGGLTDKVIGSKKVFIVHGHDEEMKQAAARAISDLNLEPIILHEQVNQGKTVIEKFEKFADVGFALILLSPDDECHVSKAQEERRARARQNVILEMGFFLGKLDRSRVMALNRVDSRLELPSDYSGVLYVPYDSEQNWRFQLVKELKAAGYAVDANLLLNE